MMDVGKKNKQTKVDLNNVTKHELLQNCTKKMMNSYNTKLLLWQLQNRWRQWSMEEQEAAGI